MTCPHDAADQDTATHFDGLCPLCLQAENERLRAALEPFAEVARWAERNGHNLAEGFDMLLRSPDGAMAGHLQVQSPDFIRAKAVLDEQAGMPKEG